MLEELGHGAPFGSPAFRAGCDVASTLRRAASPFRERLHARNVQSATFAGYARDTVERAPDFLGLLEPEDRAALEAAAMRRKYPRGCVILHRGDDSTGILVLIEGRVKI